MDEGLKARAIYWLAGKLPPCEDITRMASVSLERPLTVRERLQKRLHLLICVWCSRYWSQVRTIRDVARAHAHDVEDDVAGTRLGLSDDAKGRLERMLRERGR
jgi:hypothetical protein